MPRGPKPAKSKEAKPPVARKPPKGDGARVRNLEKRLAEAQEQQTATSEILAVISSSPTDLEPVFDTIAEHAVRLCDAAFGAVVRFDGEWINIAALSGLRPDEREAVLRYFPIRPTPGGPGLSRVMQTGAAVHIPDVQVDPGWRAGSAGPHFSTVEGFRTFLAVPLMREGQCLGAVNVWRREVSPFSEQHIALLKTFADQAVIAIENVRLFTELQEKNRALTEAHAQVTESLEQQTATGEVLRVISSSPTDVQPVFDAVAESAARLCESFDSAIWRQEGDQLRLVAHHGAIPQTGSESFLPLIPSTVGGRSVLGGRTVHIADVQTEGDEFSTTRENARRQGFRTILSVPLMRESVATGAIILRRTEAQPFTERQVALLQTFADQAVIAIENVRLFTELQEKNKALTQAHAQVTEALEQQTATAEILRVISQSPTNVQPVFDAIVDSAVRLC